MKHKPTPERSVNVNKKRWILSLVAALALCGLLASTALAQEPPRRLRGLGKVTAIEGDTLTVETRQYGTIALLTDADTRCRVPGVEDPSIDDIEVGDILAGIATKQDDDTLLAKFVAVVPPRLDRKP
jgi:hypothetical protein